MPKPLCPVKGMVHLCKFCFLWFERQIWLAWQLISSPSWQLHRLLALQSGVSSTDEQATGLRRPHPNKAIRELCLPCRHKAASGPSNCVENSRDGPLNGKLVSMWTVCPWPELSNGEKSRIPCALLLLYL